MKQIPRQLLNLCRVLRRAHTLLLVSWKQWSRHLCGLSCSKVSQNGHRVSIEKEVLEQLWLLLSVLRSWVTFLAGSGFAGPCLQTNASSVAGAQPKCCGKAKEFELCAENGKGNIIGFLGLSGLLELGILLCWEKSLVFAILS